MFLKNLAVLGLMAHGVVSERWRNSTLTSGNATDVAPPQETPVPVTDNSTVPLFEPEEMKEPSDELLQVLTQLYDNTKERRAEEGDSSKPAPSLAIDMVFHVRLETEEKIQNVTDEALSRQVDALNKAFKPGGITFTHRGTSEDTVRSTFEFSDFSRSLRSRIRVGNQQMLNILIADRLGDQFGRAAGYGTFPDKLKNFPREDGVVLSVEALPGSVSAVHEVGHWLGLLHTNQGGCGQKRGGDLIDDTPPEQDEVTVELRRAWKECKPRDTCPEQEGQDSFRNYMGNSAE